MRERYLLSRSANGLLTIYSPGPPAASVVLSFIPRDSNGALNVGGLVSIGSFDGVDAAKAAAGERYSVSADSWTASDQPFGKEETEDHVPNVEGHHIRSPHG